MLRKKAHWWQLGVLIMLMIGMWLLVPHTFAASAQGFARIGIAFIGYISLILWFRSHNAEIRRDEDIYREALLHHNTLPMTERQARYRLAMLHRRQLKVHQQGKPPHHRPA